MAKLTIQDLPCFEVVTLASGALGPNSAVLGLQGGLLVRASGSSLSQFGIITLSTTTATAQGKSFVSTYSNSLTVTRLLPSGQSLSSGTGIAFASASWF
jgi:hypothetical protein